MPATPSNGVTGGAPSAAPYRLAMSDLTQKEQALLDQIREGMDAPGCGWLHELTPFENDHITAGVLGSLIEKGLVRSDKDDETAPGYPPAYWVTLID